MSELKTFTVDLEHQGYRLDKFMAVMLPDFSRSALQKMIKDGHLKVNGQPCDLQRRETVVDDVLELNIPAPERTQLKGEDIPLDILFEDDSLLVVNKAAGMVVHPAVGNWSGTLVNALIGRNEDFGNELEEGEMRPGIVHRLDKDTSGCLVVAKTPQALLALTRAFSERKVKKTYAAIVCGIPRFYHEKIVTMIGRHSINRKKMAVDDRGGGKEAITEYDLLSHGLVEGHPASILAVRIATGRTHQIRVHLAFKKLPVLGDELYGGHQKIAAPRQMLHAWKIKFPHPVTGREMRFKAPWPDDFTEFAAKIGPIPGSEEDIPEDAILNENVEDGKFEESDIDNAGPGPDGNWME